MKYCLITDRKLYHESLVETAAAAEASNVDYFQLREKDLSIRDLLALAKSIRPQLKKTLFIVNGSLEVALASAADGVHLQKENIPVGAVRSRFPHLKIGYSAHSLDEISAAEQQGASYVFISPVYRPFSKTSSETPIGEDVAAKWSRSAEIPVFALGGISGERLATLKSAGVGAVAGISLFIHDGRFTNEGMVL
jgi:thiamine-phosphate pyrophosphorylase